MIKVKQEEVESVKVAVRGLESREISVKNTITKSIYYMEEQYRISGNIEYLMACRITNAGLPGVRIFL